MSNAPIQEPLVVGEPKSKITSLPWLMWLQSFNSEKAYGCMHAYSLGAGFTIAIDTADTWTLISNAAISGGTCRGFTFQNAQELKCTVAGVYHVVWSIAFESVSNNQEVEGTVAIGSTVQTSTASHALIANGSKPGVISGSGILTLAINEVVRLYISNHTGTADIIVDHLTLSLTKVN